MDNIKLFNTPTIEGYKIEGYMGLVTANQVAGTGFMNDFVASFSDFFGGHSGAYREEMNRLFEDVKENLQEQASGLGGNAIIGVRVDFDNISAKNMSMFMVSMQGTVVRIKPIVDEIKQETTPKGIVTNDLLILEYRKKLYKRKLENGQRINEEEWKYVTLHNMPDLSELLYKDYIKAKADSAALGASETLNWFPKYLSRLTFSQAVELLYNKEDCLVEQIKLLHLFSPKHVLDYAKQGKLDLVFLLLKTDKRSYSKTDLQVLKELAQYLQNLPDRGKIEEVKAGIFSSGGLKFICECGCKNDKDIEYCESCGKNIKGLTLQQKYQLDAFMEQVEILQQLMEASVS